MFKFAGGVHPPIYKSNTKDKKIRPAKLPKKVFLALSQHTGKPSLAIVKPGDYVEVGAKIASAAGFISSNLHSPVSGKVLAIERAEHPISGKSLSIIIESDGQQRELGVGSKELGVRGSEPGVNIEALSPESIIQAISEAGIVGLGGAAFPTHVKLSPPREKKIDTLIINGAECEPYLTCDHRLMLERSGDILMGAVILCKALGVKKCLIGIEDNKQDAIEILKSEIRNPKSETNSKFKIQNSKMDIVSVPTKYPQGAERQLIETLLDREVPSGGLPFDVGVVVQNVATAAAVYEAAVLNKPLYERVVTISGDCIKEPGNLLVKIGTPVSDLVEDCGGFVTEPQKIIFGGPMMGIAQWSLDVPVLKGTSGVLFLSKDAAPLEEEGVCIRCAGCVRVCPVGLEPTNIYYAAAKARFDLAREYNASDCIECGACSFECPAKLDLVGLIKYAKLMIRK